MPLDAGRRSVARLPGTIQATLLVFVEGDVCRHVHEWLRCSRGARRYWKITQIHSTLAKASTWHDTTLKRSLRPEVLRELAECGETAT